MCDSPLLSVIIPCYNGQKYLGECLDSVLLQDIESSDYEVIIIDDGSTDKTSEIANDYCTKHNNFRYLLIGNSGASIARNKGIDIAKGKYIVFLDSDDKWIPGKMKENLARIGEEDVISFGYHIGDKRCNIVNECRVKPGKKNLSKDFIQYAQSGCTYIFRRSFLYKYDIKFKERAMVCEDKVFVETALYCADNVLFIDNPFYIYRRNPKSVTKTVNRLTYKNMITAYEIRIWESKEIIGKRSYGKENDIITQRRLKALAVGALLEMLQGYFRYSYDIKSICNEMLELGLYDVIKQYRTYGLSQDVEKGFKLFLKHPRIFATRYRLGWMIRCIARSILEIF